MTTEQPALSEKPRLRLSRSTVFPLVGSRSAWSQEHLLPIFATLVVGMVLLLMLRPHADLISDDKLDQAWSIYWLLALYMAFVVNCYVNEMCLRARHLWLMIAVALTTYLLLEGPLWRTWFIFFHRTIPAELWQKSDYAVVQLLGWFVAAGLNEESFKALPLFAVAALGGGFAYLAHRTKGAWGTLFKRAARNIGLTEPLDGIVLGVASGTGFFVDETLNQYVPDTIADVHGAGTQAFDGLVLLLSR